MDNLLRGAALYKFLILLTVEASVLSLEEPTPEIYLQPRNFNPHPYEVGRGEERGNNGPVVFPETSEENLVVDRKAFISIPKISRVESTHPVDSHPYAKVAKKHKNRVPGRHSNQNNMVSDQDYKALAKHASKVLLYPPEKLKKVYNPSREEEQEKDYAFSYKVKDHLSGDDFSHTQARNSKATNGEYRVKLPDGRVQIVSYTADKNGYKADVRYTEDDGDGARCGMSHQGENLGIHPLPVQHTRIYNTPDHYPNRELSQLNYQAVLPTHIPPQYSNVDLLVTSQPTYLNAIHTKNLQGQTQPKVEIYTTNARDQTGYIPSTVAPYVLRNRIRHRIRKISPRIINHGDQGLFVHTTSTPYAEYNDHTISSTPSPLNIGSYRSTSTSKPFILIIE